jgi:hypothetical protein
MPQSCKEQMEVKKRRQAWATDSEARIGREEENGSSAFQYIAQEMEDQYPARQLRDELLHLEDGIVMTYRVLTQSKSDSSSNSSSSHTYTDTDIESVPLSEELPSFPSSSPFTLVVVPDLFMTLDTLQSLLKALLVKYPFARLVLVGLPGLPNTIWPSDCKLSPDLQARGINRLLIHLHSTYRMYSGNHSSTTG